MTYQMMWSTKILVMVVATCWMSTFVDSSQTVMKAMTKNFVKAYEECAKEYDLPESTGAELFDFWKEGYVLTSRNAGCAIYCLTSKLDLLDPDGNLHHGNTVEFAKQHGSDDAMARQIIDILHTCEKAAASIEDKCMLALDVAMCFKKEIHKLDWAPDNELMFEELVGEMSKQD